MPQDPQPLTPAQLLLSPKEQQISDWLEAQYQAVANASAMKKLLKGDVSLEVLRLQATSIKENFQKMAFAKEGELTLDDLQALSGSDLGRALIQYAATEVKLADKDDDRRFFEQERAFMHDLLKEFYKDDGKLSAEEVQLYNAFDAKLRTDPGAGKIEKLSAQLDAVREQWTRPHAFLGNPLSASEEAALQATQKVIDIAVGKNGGILQTQWTR